MFHYSIPTEFILLGITNAPEVKVVLFVLFLIIYLVILVTNLEMIISVRIDSQLHLPMYFFLHHMSFSDLCYSTDIGSKMLVDFFAKDKPIFFIGCALKFHVFCYFTDCESLLLAVMAFDRYMAINNSVLYTVNMSSQVCYLLMARVHMVTMMDILLHTILTFTVTFCRSIKINHFLCDVPPPQLIFSSDTHVNELVIFTVFGFIEMVSISVVLISFCYTTLSVFKIHSSEGRGKTFSACTSHLTAVPVFFLCTSDQVLPNH